MSSDFERRPRPVPTPFTRPFWIATREGRLLVQRCDDCRRLRWTPQLACPECWSQRASWIDASGRGSVYSYTVVHRAVDPARFDVPYVLAIVRLEEGVHVLTNLIECEPDEIRIGMPVEVRFQRQGNELALYPFAPVRD